MSKVRVAIIGVGNCANSLVQATHAYSGHRSESQPAGLTFSDIGGYRAEDIEFVAAFDVDQRKVGRELSVALEAEPNCTTSYVPVPPTNVTVLEGPVLDGVADHMCDEIALPATPDPVDVAEELRRSGADVAVCYLLGGSRKATDYYAEAALDAGVAFVNCQPEPVANDPSWRSRFEEAGLPLLGDDVKSQIGTTVINRALLELLENRGASITSAYQLNYGGNMDFLNMRDRARFASKQNSKLSAIRSTTKSSTELELVPPEHISFLKDRKLAYIHIDGEALLGMKFDIELRLSVEDSPNSAGVVIDAVRAAKVALDRGIGGIVDPVCSWCFKRPPTQMSEWHAEKAMTDFAGTRPNFSSP